MKSFGQKPWMLPQPMLVITDTLNLNPDFTVVFATQEALPHCQDREYPRGRGREDITDRLAIPAYPNTTSQQQPTVCQFVPPPWSAARH